MSQQSTPALPLQSRLFDGSVFYGGLLLALVVVALMLDGGVEMPTYALVSIPLIVLIAQFPMLLDRGAGGIEVGFDSTVLLFLLCTLPPAEALFLWNAGVLVTQIASHKRVQSKKFNIGIGILGGGLAALIVTTLRGDQLGTLQELAAVALGAAGYFATDFVVSALSVAIEERSSVWPQLSQPESVIAIACFVPFDSLGYLGAVLARSHTTWSLALLAVPLATLLIATRAVTRGRENARRLSVLFEAAGRAQTLSDRNQVVDALLEDAKRLLRLRVVELRTEPPGAHEIGARLRDGIEDRWLVAGASQRARSTVSADRVALEALAAVSSDAFARLHLAEDMTHLARHDLLTDLPTRGLLLDRVEHALQVARRRGSAVALLFVDLDGFKPVNDRFGHAAGDEVLVDVAQRLIGCVRESDTVARLGGDEFAILLEDVVPEQAQVTCERILTALREGFTVAGHQLPLSASIGIAAGDSARSADQLLRHADMAMYHAKALGKDQFVHYERSLGRSRLQRLELVESLRAAVTAGDITLVYQPVSDVETGRIVGVEGLARWTCDGVSIPPDVFIGAAEESGLIVALGDLVLDQAARDAERLAAAARGDLNIGVNVSAQQLREPAFEVKVEETAARMSGAKLVLEITERDGITNDTVSIEAMERIAALGVTFAIDDFGVGFSSIGYLTDMPVKIIKADASFSASIDGDERACSLLRSIALMGDALGLDVVVEGIERLDQLDHLREHVGAAYAQGFLLHRPMPLAQVCDVIRQNRAAPLTRQVAPSA